MGMGKEALRGVDPEFTVAKGNRRQVQIAERGRHKLHLSELLLERRPNRRVIERRQHLEERRIRKT